MASLYFDNRYSSVVEKLYDNKDETTGKGVFDTLWQLMIFLAMVGRQKQESCKGEVRLETKNRFREIKDFIFEQAHKDGIAYLLAIDQEQNGEILREGNEDKIWQYLEIYAAIGIEEVDSWLLQYNSLNPREVILTKMKEMASSNIKNERPVFSPPKY